MALLRFRQPRDIGDTSDLRKHVENRDLLLIEKRLPVLEYWQQLAQELIPSRMPYLIDPLSEQKAGEQNAHIVDSVGPQALQTSASGIQQGLMPATAPFFHLQLHNEFGPTNTARSFLQRQERAMRQVINASNANHVLGDFKLELVGFGTAAALHLDDDEQVIRLMGLSVGEYCIEEDYRGRVDTIYRHMTMTVGQLAQEFGVDRLSESTRSLYENDSFDQVVQCVHAIEPDGDRRNPDRVRHQPFRSVYFELTADSRQVLDIRGYDRFPALVSRWLKLPGTAYGYGRGMDALPHLRRLRKMLYRFGQALAFKAEPPLQLPIGVTAHEVQAQPGGRTFVPVGGEIKNLFGVELELREFAEAIERTRQDVRDSLGATLVSSLRSLQHQMTATEVNTRTTQDLMEFMPSLYRLQEELVAPFVEMTWASMERAGLIRDLPEELQRGTIDIEFTSPLARKARQPEVDAIVRTYAIAGEVAKVRPDVADMLNVDKAIREVAEIEGAVEGILYTVDEMREQRMAKQQAQLAEQTAAAAQQGTDIAKGLAETQKIQSESRTAGAA